MTLAAVASDEGWVYDYGVVKSPITAQRLAALSIALLQSARLVIFRGLSLSEQSYVDFGLEFGDIDLPIENRNADHPVIEIIRRHKSTAPYRKRSSFFWHSDSSFMPHPPSHISLYSKLPPSIGGRTGFINMGYRRLAARYPERERIKLMSARHELMPIFGEILRAKGMPPSEIEELSQKYPPFDRPLVIDGSEIDSHAVVYTNPLFVMVISRDGGEQLTRAEHALIYRCLFVPGNTYQHKWLPGDLLVWDNMALIHRAMPSMDEDIRLLWKLTLRRRNRVAIP